jgi:hypothetical protein
MKQIQSVTFRSPSNSMPETLSEQLTSARRIPSQTHVVDDVRHEAVNGQAIVAGSET